ncbi:MAG: hypothetical protein CUN52_02445 [Phototrophicales bacterium]|jgi:hypothetical protein|nr:MAG: hypothetical protein CUN52_02445 [Phototrophicales bacterium]
MIFLRRFIPLLLILIIGMYFRMVAIQQTDPTNVIEQPLLDDSFYYITLGRNLADGKGAMVDDQHLTTGFQPLWGAMSVFPALLTDDLSSLVHLFQWMGVLVSAVACVLVYVLTVEVLTQIAPIQSGWVTMMAWLNAAVWYWHPHHIAYSINGMETTLSTCATLFMLVIFLRLYHRPSPKYALILGMSMGVAFLARVDASMLIVWLVIAIALFPPIQGQRIATIIRVGVMSLIISSPWAVFSLAQGKFILPESGFAVRAHTLYTGQSDQLPPPLSSALDGEPAFARYYGQKMSQFIGELGKQMYPFTIGIPQPDSPFLQDINIRIVNINITHGTFLVMIGYVLIGGVTVFTRSRMIIGLWVITALWIITAIILYSFVVISWWFYERYALPIAEIVSILMFCMLYALLLRLNIKKWTAGIVLIILMINGMLLIQNYRLFTNEYRWIFDPAINHTAPRSGFYEAAIWLNENVPADSRIGAFQSGVMVYYADAPVINLDGKVNADAHRAMTEGRMWDYICDQQLDYIVDWPVMIYFLLMQRSHNWADGHLEQIALLDGWINPIQINRVNRDRCR